MDLPPSIPLGRFELPSPDPKSCMIDHYTTGVLMCDPGLAVVQMNKMMPGYHHTMV